jgi:hypothetical protein
MSDAHTSPVTVTALELKALNDWMREPDFAENFSLEDISDWINRRPIHTTARLVGDAQSPRDAVIEECARHLEQEADLATNSLHCGDNSQTIAAVHRVSRTYYEAAKSIRDLVVTSTHSEAADEPKGGQ